MGEKYTKISVIIPIYNCERYLENTLSSVRNQTYENIEIICGNDCATDASADIIAAHAASDPRIVQIRLDRNSGAGLARKKGIMASTGDYIMFLDGDDSYELDACETALSAIKRMKTDMVQFGTNIVASGITNQNLIKDLQLLLTPSEAIRSGEKGALVNCCFVESRFGFSLWNKIYRGDIVRRAVQYYVDERYDLAEDLYLFFLIAFFSASYSSIGKNLINYLFGVGITGDKPWTDKKFEQLTKVGRIVSHLNAFLRTVDALDCCADAVDTIRKDHLSSAVSRWLDNNRGLDKTAAGNNLFRYFTAEDALSEVLHRYYTGSEALRKVVVEQCAGLPVFQNRKTEIKTIGTFYFRFYNGGIERVTSMLTELWCRKGYQVVLFTEEEPTAEDYKLPEGVKRVVIPTVKQKGRPQLKDRATFWRTMLDVHQIDCMVYHAWLSDNLLGDILSIKSAGVPVVMHTHSLFACGVSYPSAEFAYRTLYISKLYGLADAVMTITKTDCEWWSMFHSNVYRTVNPIPFDINGIKVTIPQEKNLTFVGRLSPEKQIEHILDIFKIVLDAGYSTKLHLVGAFSDQEYEKKIRKKIEQLHLESSIILHGFQKDVSAFYQEAGISLLTSEFEGSPLALLESMAFGVPVVTYDLPHVDLIQKRKGLVVVPQGDTWGAAQAVIDLMRDEQTYLAMVHAARECALELYAVDLGELWAQVFDDLSHGRKAAKREPDREQMKIAVHILMDHYLKGVTLRSKENGRKAQVLQADPVKELEKRVAEGELGLRDILRFAKGWLQFKIWGQSDVYAEEEARDPVEAVLNRSKEGELGLRQILKYMGGWFRYKLLGRK